MPNHRVTEDWMGTRVVTLEDLLKPRLRAVCIGINPAPRSVEAGHYYQGRLGQTFFARLRGAGAFTQRDDAYDDDTAFDAGIGFTDIVKRPTPRASDVRADEFEYGRAALEAKIGELRPQLLIFTFKKTAQILFGAFAGNGFQHELRISDSEVFVMPGPYEATGTVERTLDELAARLRTG